jgi:mannose-P-dolichol utilization defect protein 1
MEFALVRLDPFLEPLRPYLIPVTASFPPFLKSFILSQIGEKCYAPVVEQLSLAASPACSKLAISKGLGIGIVGVSAIVKVPQLIKLLRSGSARGVSFTSYALETAAYTITLAYNYRSGNPFSTYGEIAVLAVQNVMIAVLVLVLTSRRNMAAAFVVALSSAGYALFDPALVSNEHLALCQAATIPLSLASKVPQIWTIVRERSTGQLSAFSVWLNILVVIRLLLLGIWGDGSSSGGD